LLATLRDVASDVIAWINDIVSYQKESSFNDPHNMISVLMADCGITHEQASKKTVEFINEQLDNFIQLAARARQQLGRAGGAYIEGLESWIRGVYDWSFVSERYSGDYVELSQQATHVLLCEEG
jgi:cell division protein ZapA (FtsZ GTPase activity inhibitor)